MKLLPSFPKKTVRRAARVILGTSILILAASPFTQGAVNLFTHSASTSWANASNWSLGHTPTSTDALEFTDATTNGLDGDYTVQSLSFNTTSAWNLEPDTSGSATRTLNLTGGGTNALGGTDLIAVSSSSRDVVTLGGGTGTLVINFGSANGTISVGRSAELFFGQNTNITGTAGLTDSGAGVLILASNNSYTGPTVINAGAILELGLSNSASGQLPASSPLTVNGVLQMNLGIANVMGSTLAGSGAIELESSGTTYIPTATGFTGSLLLVTPGSNALLEGNDTFGAHNTTPAAQVTIGAGALLYSDGGFFNTINNLTINGGELRAVGGANSTFPAFQLKGTVTVGGTGTSSFTAPATANSFTGIQLGNNTAGGVTTFSIPNATATLIIANVLQDGENVAGTATVASGLTKTGPGTLILSAVNIYTGPTIISGGTLQMDGYLYGGTAAGPGTVDVQNGGTLAFTHDNTFGVHNVVPQSTTTIEAGGLVTNIAPAFTTFNNLTFNGGELRANGGTSAAFPAYSLKGTVTANGPVTSTISATTTVDSFNGIALGTNVAGGVTTFGVTDPTGILTIAPAFQDSENPGGSARVTSGLTKTGPGTLILTAASTYTGPTTINAGTVSVSMLANGGSPSGIGQSSNAAANLILNGGALLDTSTSGDSTDRLFTLGTSGGEIDSNGSVTFTNTGAIVLAGTNTARTLTLGGTGTGTLAAVLGNNGTGASSLIKNSTGTWTLTGANTYSGSTQVNQGKLVVHGSLFGTANVNVGDGIDAATLSGNSPITLANAGTVTVASSGVLAPDAGGLTINAAAAGTASLAFQSGSTLQLSITNSQSSTHGAPKLSDYSALTLGTGVTASLAGLLNTNVSGTVNNGDVFPILLSSAAVSGFFDNANSSSALAVGPSTFRFTSGGQQWEINYAWTGAAPLTGEDPSTFAGVTGGTNVALLAIPEPATLTALLTGSALLLGWRRRRQR